MKSLALSPASPKGAPEIDFCLENFFNNDLFNNLIGRSPKRKVVDASCSHNNFFWGKGG